jgi:predicted RNase H-like HicB family nuclease
MPLGAGGCIGGIAFLAVSKALIFIACVGSIGGMDWKVFLEKDSDSGWYTVTVPALPGCISQGETREDALENVKEAIALHLGSLAELGVPIHSDKEVAKVSVTV